MNTFAKIGKVALAHLFAKMQIFDVTVREMEDKVKILPREVVKSHTEIDLQKSYCSFKIDDSGKSTICVIYGWGIEKGLDEVDLDSPKSNGLLEDVLSYQYYGMEKDLLSHIVVVQKNEWEEDNQSFSQEVVTIYALSQYQCAQLDDRELEDFTNQLEEDEDNIWNQLELSSNSDFSEEIEEETEEEKRDRDYEIHNPDPADEEYEKRDDGPHPWGN